MNRSEQIGGPREIIQRQIKKSASPVFPFARPVWITMSYALLLLMAWSKMVGFEVNPVTDSSSI